MSYGGLIWRAFATAKQGIADFGLGSKRHVSRIPTALWYFYWLIHKPKMKELSPYGRGRGETFQNMLERHPKSDLIQQTYLMAWQIFY